MSCCFLFRSHSRKGRRCAVLFVVAKTVDDKIKGSILKEIALAFDRDHDISLIIPHDTRSEVFFHGIDLRRFPDDGQNDRERLVRLFQKTRSWGTGRIANYLRDFHGVFDNRYACPTLDFVFDRITEFVERSFPIVAERPTELLFYCFDDTVHRAFCRILDYRKEAMTRRLRCRIWTVNAFSIVPLLEKSDRYREYRCSIHTCFPYSLDGLTQMDCCALAMLRETLKTNSNRLKNQVLQVLGCPGSGCAPEWSSRSGLFLRNVSSKFLSKLSRRSYEKHPITFAQLCRRARR